jgi:hypothetical protein
VSRKDRVNIFQAEGPDSGVSAGRLAGVRKRRTADDYPLPGNNFAVVRIAKADVRQMQDVFSPLALELGIIAGLVCELTGKGVCQVNPYDKALDGIMRRVNMSMLHVLDRQAIAKLFDYLIKAGHRATPR